MSTRHAWRRAPHLLSVSSLALRMAGRMEMIRQGHVNGVVPLYGWARRYLWFDPGALADSFPDFDSVMVTGPDYGAEFGGFFRDQSISISGVD